ncbi:MAG: endonuclease Q family protein [Candidatus Hodarchaeota archaeon]
MKIYNADLHIHSPHSIGVSKSLSLDTMVETCKKKGLNILGTGDVLQPDWLKYLEQKLQKNNDGAYSYKDVYFILQTEIEDQDSVHEVVFFESFDSVRKIQKKLAPYSKNILDQWGGRPRVNLSPAELVDIITEEGALIGPAHAFTPFKAIFRQNKFETLNECYQDAFKKVFFIELGLSANTNLADRLDCLKNVTFLSNSDAHSQDPRSLGREFNKFDIDNPSFEEILLAIKRKESRKIILNVGLHPKLGKYYNMFCNKCRRRILFKKAKKNVQNLFNQYSITENFIIIFTDNPQVAKKQYIGQVAKNKMVCPACKEELSKNFKVKLGVSERIDVISTYEKPIHPEHRPHYINAVPLIDIIRSIKKIKSTSSKSVLNDYNNIINELGNEFEILIDLPFDKIDKFDKNIASLIKAFRNDEIEYTPGGGGTYGQIKLEI